MVIERYGLKNLNKNLYKKVKLMDLAKISLIEEAKLLYEKQKKIELKLKQKELTQKIDAENKTKFLYEQIIVPFAEEELKKDFITKCFPKRNIVECYSKEDGFLFALHCRPISSPAGTFLEINTRNFSMINYYITSYKVLNAPKDSKEEIVRYKEKIKQAIVQYLNFNYLKNKENNNQYEIL